MKLSTMGQADFLSGPLLCGASSVWWVCQADCWRLHMCARLFFTLFLAENLSADMRTIVK